MVELRLGNGELALNGIDFHFGMIKKFWRCMVAMVHNNVNVLNATGLYT